MQKCLDFLNCCDIVDKTKPQRTVDVPTIYDKRFMVHKHHVATMEQRKQLLEDRVTESQLTLDYWQTRDFKKINRHIEKVVLPRLNVYCTERLHIKKDMHHVILECIAILYTYLYADVPVFGYEYRLKAMLRYWQQHGNLGYYDNIPDPIHEAVDAIDVSVLEQKFVVKRHN